MKVIVILSLTIAVTLVVLLVPSIPLGVSGEWTWPRHALPADIMEALDRLLAPLLVAIVLMAFCRFVDQRIARLGSLRRTMCLGLLAASTFVWMNAVRQAAPTPHRELRPLWVLYDRFASGYFAEACFRVMSDEELLSTYEARMAKGDVLHEGTHPPGLFLISWWALQTTQRSKLITTLAEGTQSTNAVQLFRSLEADASLERRLSRSELAALALLSFVSSALAALVVVPIFGLVSHVAGSQPAWRAACLMLTVPSLSVFAPRSDVVYAFSGAMLLWLMVLSQDAQHRVLRGVLPVVAGAWGFLCLSVSLAHLPIVVAGCLYALINTGRERSGTAVVRAVIVAFTMLVTGFICVGMFYIVTECNLLSVWTMNLRNHAGFYSTSPRTWWLWAVVNLLELAFSVGVPLMGFALMSTWQCVRGLVSSDNGKTAFGHLDVARSRRATSIVLSMSVTWMLLWLSGKNMGEAARLWCVLTPWCAICAAIGWRGMHAASAEQQRFGNSIEAERTFVWLCLLASQFIVCTVTVGRVSGYLQL